MMMCSRSVSGSSLLSGYNEDDARETNGRSRREFEEIDAVLYNEEKAKRSSIKKICEEWSSRPHFRIRGRLQQIEKQPLANAMQSHKQHDITHFDITGSSSFDLFISSSKVSSSNSNELNVLLHDNASGRSSNNSIEGSELTNNSDSDNNDATDTILDDHRSGTGADSFDTDEDDDENNDCSSDISTHDHAKHRHGHAKNPQALIKCMKDSIVNSLTTKLLQRFLADQQPLLQRYGKHFCERNSIKLRRKLRPNSLPPHSMSQNRFSYPSVTSTQLQIASTPYRSTPEPDMKGLLLVTRLHTANSGTHTITSSSPRKSKLSSALSSNERVPTSLAIDKRNQQQISLIGTALANSPSTQLSISTTPQSSQAHIRQTSSTYRYRSATTLHTDSNTRLPPINIERLINNDPGIINRSNTATSGMVESIPSGTRAVSGTSIGSNPSSAIKLRTSVNVAKLQRTSRPIFISSFNNNNKDFNNLLSTSPTRSITTTPAPSTSLRTTTVARTQHQKRPLITTKTRPPPSPSILKLSAPHIW